MPIRITANSAAGLLTGPACSKPRARVKLWFRLIVSNSIAFVNESDVDIELDNYYSVASEQVIDYETRNKCYMLENTESRIVLLNEAVEQSNNTRIHEILNELSTLSSAELNSMSWSALTNKSLKQALIWVLTKDPAAIDTTSATHVINTMLAGNQDTQVDDVSVVEFTRPLEQYPDKLRLFIIKYMQFRLNVLCQRPAPATLLDEYYASFIVENSATNSIVDRLLNTPDQIINQREFIASLYFDKKQQQILNWFQQIKVRDKDTARQLRNGIFWGIFTLAGTIAIWATCIITEATQDSWPIFSPLLAVGGIAVIFSIVRHFKKKIKQNVKAILDNKPQFADADLEHSYGAALLNYLSRRIAHDTPMPTDRNIVIKMLDTYSKLPPEFTVKGIFVAAKLAVKGIFVANWDHTAWQTTLANMMNVMRTSLGIKGENPEEQVVLKSYDDIVRRRGDELKLDYPHPDSRWKVASADARDNPFSIHTPTPQDNKPANFSIFRSEEKPPEEGAFSTTPSNVVVELTHITSQPLCLEP